MFIKPWGIYEILHNDADCKIKKIIINPGQSPSYQYHFKRSETWIIVHGEGLVKLEEKTFNVQKGDIVSVPIKAKHCIKNVGKENLIFIEIQQGTYFGEDDIVRLEDIYGRL